MFARVIAAQSRSESFDAVIRLAEQQLPKARALPGFSGYHLLTDPDSGKAVILSAGASGIQSEGVSATHLTGLHLETFEVPVSG